MFEIKNAYLEGKEGKKPTDIEVSSIDGMWTWNFKYEDGSVGPEERTGISTNNHVGIQELIADLKKKNKIL